jgi:hypothetical protein
MKILCIYVYRLWYRRYVFGMNFACSRHVEYWGLQTRRRRTLLFLSYTGLISGPGTWIPLYLEEGSYESGAACEAAGAPHVRGRGYIFLKDITTLKYPSIFQFFSTCIPMLDYENAHGR